MQPPRSHGHAGITRGIGPGLMRVAMKNETIDSMAKCPIAEDFHAVWMAEPFFRVRRRKGFSAGDRFSIDMRRGGHLHATVGHAVGRPGPELGHRLIDAPG